MPPGWRMPQELQPKEGLGREEEHQLVLLGVEQLIVCLDFSGLGHGVAKAEAGGAGQDQQDEGQDGGEPLDVQGGWW